ncbi:DUF6615 family protein [Microbacterium sp. MC2]
MSIAKQARILDDGAKSTNKRILRDHGNGVTPHEETLTQNFVSDYIAKIRRAKLRASVNEFTKQQEARLYGADIALWFVNAAGKFAGVHLQSKVLRSDGTYGGLDHHNRHGRQYDMLINGAKREGALAGYAFYNGLRGAEPSTSACGHGDGAPDINGISIASATAIGPHVARSVRRKDVEQICSPLSCLVRHWGVTSGPGGGGGGGGPVGGVGGFGGSGGGGASGAPSPDLPSALLGLAEAWQQPEARLHDQDSIPEYVRKLAERMNERAARPIDDDQRSYVDDLDLWLPYPGYPEPVAWSDIYPFVTTVLVGPS